MRSNTTTNRNYAGDISAALVVVWQLVSVQLKLGGTVTWSWWVTLLPLLAVLTVFVATFALGAIRTTLMIRKMKKSMDNLTKR
jgi:hypothetical protein